MIWMEKTVFHNHLLPLARTIDNKRKWEPLVRVSYNSISFLKSLSLLLPRVWRDLISRGGRHFVRTCLLSRFYVVYDLWWATLFVAILFSYSEKVRVCNPLTTPWSNSIHPMGRPILSLISWANDSWSYGRRLYRSFHPPWSFRSSYSWHSRFLHGSLRSSPPSSVPWVHLMIRYL